MVTVPLRCVQLEEELDRMEGEKLELAGARHQLELAGRCSCRRRSTRRGWVSEEETGEVGTVVICVADS